MTVSVDDLWFRTRRDRDAAGRLLPATPTKRHGRGKRWRVRYVDDAGRGAVQLFAKRPDAERFDAAVRTDVARGQYVDPIAGRESVSSYSARWRDAQLHAPSSAQLVEGLFRRHILPVIGGLPMAQVRPTHLQLLITKSDLAPNTLRSAYGVLSAMFNAAVADRVIAATPCRGVSLPAVDDGDHVIPTPEQVHALAAGLPPRYRALVYVGAGCGLRHGEALGLEVTHVDFLRRELHVQQQMTVVIGRSPHLVAPKTRTSRRVVELPQVTATALARHMEEFPPRPVEVDDDTDRRRPRRRDATLLFTNSAARPIHRSPWSRLWSPVAQSVGLPERTGYHSLRHYFATLLIHNGASVKTVQMALGHSSPTITLDTYVGLWPDQIDRTRTLVDHALGVVPAEAMAT